MRRFAAIAALTLAAPALTAAQAPQLRPAFSDQAGARREIEEVRVRVRSKEGKGE